MLKLRLPFLLLMGFLTLTSCATNSQLDRSVTARTLMLDNSAWAGSSVNVLAGVRQALYTDSVHQFAGYYNDKGRVVLAKRRLGEDQWQHFVTGFTGNVNDAHNHISLIVDGAGYLHVAWDHHNSQLNYARGDQPGSLHVTQQPMLGVTESSVTYPQFYRLQNGDVLFQYRDGGSGRGALVVNYYSTDKNKWQRLHDALIDGEGQRSAYWDMAIDQNGILHLAWNWRETPDVATNHDIAYARSNDNGLTWTRLDGSQYKLPITQSTAQVIKAVPQNHKLMNPPVVAADSQSNPFIAGYWADAAEKKPHYRVLYNTSGSWQEITGPAAKNNFDLKGMGTKRPPWSRAALLVESDWQKSWFHLIYRDDFSGGVVAATVKSLESPNWQEILLLKQNVGAWEPSYDPAQWHRLKQAQLLLQKVTQLDGDDLSGSSAPATPLSVLIWSPNWERHQNLQPVSAPSPSEGLIKPLNGSEILAIAEVVAKWQWQNIPEGWDYQLRSWTMAPFYIGNLAVASLLPDSELEQRMLAQAQQLNWQPHDRIYDADDHCVIQAYLKLYLKYRDKQMMIPSKARLDQILASPAPGSLDWGTSGSRDRWSWSDSLFMGPMSWLLMYRATGEEKYLAFMNREWWATTERLYRSGIGLYFRDESYLDLRERNGKTIHWARGTGWSVAGLAQVLEYLPKSHPDYSRYQKQLQEMAAAFLAAQQADGLWRPGLLDPATHTARETSGSAFIVFALAWGINHGLLDKNTYGAAVVKGWNALVDCVSPQGKLEHVQPIGAAPHGFDPSNSEPFASGAFLLAASEVFKLSQSAGQ